MRDARLLIPVIIALLLFPFAVTACPEVELGDHPGFKTRFSGNATLGQTVVVPDFEVKITKIFTDAISLEISRLGSFYDKGSASKGSDGIFKKPDIWVEVFTSDPQTDNANIAIYTPQRANVTAALTDISVLRTESGRTQLFPNEVVELEFTSNNTGELPAQNIGITSEFGEFQVLSTDARNISLCQNESYKFRYTLKSPNVRKTFNYTLYLRLDYSDENVQLARKNLYTEYKPVEVEIIPAAVEIARRVSNWTLATGTREVIVEVTLNNTGKSTAYDVQWSDAPPPDLLVTRGTTSFSGRLDEGRIRILSYSIISDDPIICRSRSTATYKDQFGNDYFAFSTGTSAKFSPYVVIVKELYPDGFSVRLEQDKSTTIGNKTMRIGESANVSIKVKNLGNALARNLVANDTTEGLVINGTPSWSGDLKPGEEISFGYNFIVNRAKPNFTSSLSYRDLDLDAFNESAEFQIGALNYCSKTLKTVSYSTSKDINILYPEITLSTPSTIEALSDFEFNYTVGIKNNGTDGAHDLFLLINSTGLRAAPIRFGGEILRGQPFYYIKELKSGAEQNFSLLLRAPLVDNRSTFSLIATINYTDFHGRSHISRSNTTLDVVRPKPAVAIVALIEKELNFTIAAPNETEIGEYGEGYINLQSTGYAPLQNVSLEFALPPGLELFSNDTRWEGRFEAQLRRENQTWLGFVENVSWHGNLSRGETKKIDFLLRGSKAGFYSIPYRATFDGNSFSGVMTLKVKGAILRIEKTLDRGLLNLGEEAQVTIRVENIGEDSAKGVIIADRPSENFAVEGNTTMRIDELGPGENATLSYLMRSKQPGLFGTGIAKVEWSDALGNQYAAESSEPVVNVPEPPPPPTSPPPTTEAPTSPPPTPLETPPPRGLTQRELLFTTAFVVMILWILIQLLSLSRPPSSK